MTILWFAVWMIVGHPDSHLSVVTPWSVSLIACIFIDAILLVASSYWRG